MYRSGALGAIHFIKWKYHEANSQAIVQDWNASYFIYNLFIKANCLIELWEGNNCKLDEGKKVIHRLDFYNRMWTPLLSTEKQFYSYISSFTFVYSFAQYILWSWYYSFSLHFSTAITPLFLTIFSHLFMLLLNT